MIEGDDRHPQPPRRFRRVRAWLSRHLLGVDLRSELQAIHVAMSEAIMDLGEDIHSALEAQNRAAATEILKRADLLAERLDRKTEGLSAALSRRVGALERAGRPMSDRAYAEFENRIRGSEAEVRAKLRLHVDLFRFAPVVDLGCGRGELLEELRRASVPSYGVDSNKVMVAGARAKGLRVLHEDLFDHLERLENASLGGIAATHVIEHLTPPAVRHLLNEARRVLAPGGTILLETPNPTSLWAYVQSWGRDPTHRWAPHPDTLAFMAERAGLRVVSTFYASPVPDEDRLKAADPDAERLNEFLYGPQDLVLVAEKPLTELPFADPLLAEDLVTEPLPAPPGGGDAPEAGGSDPLLT
jgi:SAM-dependent methyltransferase